MLVSTFKALSMTHPSNAQQNTTAFDQLMELLLHDGPEAMANALTTLLNHATRIESERVLGADAHQRTDQRRGVPPPGAASSPRPSPLVRTG